MREFLEGDIAVCIGHDAHVEYGPHCFVWVETTGLPMAKIHDGIYAGGAPIGGDEVRGENTGRHTSTIAWTDPGYATVFDRLDFLTEDGYHIIVEDLLLTWKYGGTDDCVASAVISARQR